MPGVNLLSLLLPLALFGGAGGPRPAPDHVIWSGGHRILLSARELRLSDEAGRDEVPIPLPPGTLWASWREDGIYALVQDPGKPGGPEGLRVLVRAPQAKTWELYAALPPSLGAVRAALPTADGRLFLVPDGAYLQVPGAADDDASGWAPFLLMGRDSQGRWTRFEPVDLAWGPPFRAGSGRNGQGRRYNFLASARIEAADLRDRLFEFDGGWALVDRHHGMVWVFDANGAVKRHISLYDTFKEEDLDAPLSDFPTAVLACEAAPGGKLILALRNETAFFYARKVWPTSVDPKRPEPADAHLLRQAQSAKDFPGILWREVELGSGEVHSLPQPPGLPSTYSFRPEDPNWHFTFRVTTDGLPAPAGRMPCP